MKKPSPSNGYIPSLDGIRAVSILIVFLAHVGVSDLIPGGLGVTVFFFLSGFLITTLLTQEHDRYGSISLSAFYLRRVLRLGPPLLITLATATLLVLVGIAKGALALPTFLSQILFYFNYYWLLAGPSYAHSVEGFDTLWSLAVEEHFYLIWPMLFILYSAHLIRFRTIVGLTLAILVWRALRLFVFGTDPWTIYLSTDTRLDSLLYGCLLALMMWRGTAERLFASGVLARVLWIFGALVVLAGVLLVRDEAFRAILRYSLQGAALMPLFYYAVTRPNDILFRPLNWAWVRRLGLWSYTIYLIHFVIVKALIQNGISEPGQPLFIAIVAVSSVSFAAAVYSWVEVPLKPLRARLTGHAARRSGTGVTRKIPAE